MRVSANGDWQTYVHQGPSKRITMTSMESLNGVDFLADEIISEIFWRYPIVIRMGQGTDSIFTSNFCSLHLEFLARVLVKRLGHHLQSINQRLPEKYQSFPFRA